MSALTTPLEDVFLKRYIFTEPLLTLAPPVDGHKITEDISATAVCTIAMIISPFMIMIIKRMPSLAFIKSYY